MNTGLILHTVLGLLLLLIPAGALYLLERQTLKSFGKAIVRMAVQLLVVCLMVWGLLRVDSPWLSVAWLMVMAVISGFLVLKRCKLVGKPVNRSFDNSVKILMSVAAGLFLGVFLVGLWLLGVVFPVRAFAAQWFVPVTALLLGHSTTMMIHGLNIYISGLKADKEKYEFMRGSGQTHLTALQPFLKRSLLAVVMPTIANLSVLGLFTMPLMLGGILLGGVAPVNAFFIMLCMTVGCVSASVLSLAITIFIADRILFDKLGKFLLTLAMMLVAVACTGHKGGEAAQAEFMSAGAETVEAEGQTAVSGGQAQKAKTVVMYEMPAKLADRPEQILKRRGYTTSYNSRTKAPNWVAWHLTKDHTYGSNLRDQEVFTEDESVKTPRATDNDYYNSRYDRGHMCPAGDNKWDRQAMTESFLFTNVCPQNHGLNKYEWNDLEILCRDWARKYGAVDIVCGPLYSSEGERFRVGEGSLLQQKTIGRNKVWVPDAFFKVVLCRKGKPKAIGFVYRNEGKKQPMEEAVCSVDEIETMTGIDFFPALDDTTERRVEANASLSEW